MARTHVGERRVGDTHHGGFEGADDNAQRGIVPCCNTRQLHANYLKRVPRRLEVRKSQDRKV